MDLNQLEDSINDKTKMLILCNPHNPGGSAWTTEELSALGAVCARHDIMVISDEIHADLVLPPGKHVPFAKAVSSKQVRSITCMAASKTFNLAGMSTSVVIIPDPEVHKVYDQLIHTVHINMGNIFGAIATESAYDQGEDWLGQLLNYLQGNRDFLVDYLAQHLPEIRMLVPEATYLAWIDFSALGLKDDELRYLMVEKGQIGLSPGTLFGPGGSGFMRINFGTPRKLLEEGLGRMVKAIRQLEQES